MESEYVPSILQVHIDSFSEKYVNNQTETFYLMNITNTYTNKKWSIERCFPDFEALETNIASIIPNPPVIEGKTLFKVSAYGELNKRQIELQQFINVCLVRKDIMSNAYFTEFLEIDHNSPELIYNKETFLNEFDGLPLSIKRFIYLDKDGVLFVICSDSNLTSRMDAYITNLNLPWEQKSDTHISVGCFYAFKVTFDSSKGFKFEKAFAKSFPEQTGAIAYDANNMVLCIGLASGTVMFYKIFSESQFTQYDYMNEYCHHQGMVTGIAYDSKAGYMYSCGADHKLIACETSYLDNPTEVYESLSEYTNMIYDNVHQRLFLTTTAGEVDVFVTSSYPPTLVNTVQTSSEDAIVNVAVDYKSSYLFTCSVNGMISILDLGNPGKEKTIKEISSFGEGEGKQTAIVFDAITRELIVADEFGRIMVYSLKTGQPTYVFEAHAKPVNCMYYDNDAKVLMTGGDDMLIKGWKLPERWISEEIKKFEENEVKNMSDTFAMLKLQKSLEKDADYNSDEDSLNGWDYLQDLDEE